MSTKMSTAIPVPRNTAAWWGLFFGVLAIGCNAAFFVNAPGQRIFPWLSLLFAGGALIALAIGVRRAYGGPQNYRGRTLTVVLTVVALLPIALSGLGFVAMRKLPSAAEAPQVGQKVPDFTLPDTSGKPVSLDQLLAPADTESRAPRAVLLIFYRGYW